MKKSQDLILNGSFEAQKIFKFLRSKIKNQQSKIGLAAVLIGKDPASQIYINIKEKRTQELGVYFEKYILPATISEKKILDLINKLNKNKKITGILVQLPLPKKFNTDKIIGTIDERKDVDGFLAQETRKHKSTGNTKAQKQIIPPTIQAILHLIKMSKIKLAGKKAVILSNSLEFAGPLKKELEKNKIKVDIILFCHSVEKRNPEKKEYNFFLDPDWSLPRHLMRGRDDKRERIFVGVSHQLQSQSGIIRKADIIIIALGKKHFLKPNMIKKNVVVIDVGINRINGKIYGDVHPECFKKSKYISSVPGGVGPLTVAYLMKNLVNLALNK